MYNWSVIHGIKRKPHLSVVWNWYHFVAIAILHQPRPTDSADINTRLQLSDTSSIPPMHGGFLLGLVLNRGQTFVYTIDSQDQLRCLNSLAPGRCRGNIKSTMFELIIENSSLSTWCEIAPRWMPRNLTNEKSTLLQLTHWGLMVNICGPWEMWRWY